jgi:hypothetical protein
MPITDLTRPKITVFFTGFVLSRVKAGNAIAEVAALNTSPCHQPKVSAKKITSDGQTVALEDLSFDIGKDFDLKVENTTRTKIEEFPLDSKERKKFNRSAGTGDKDDFRWHIDLDTDLFKGENLVVAHEKLSPVFRINNALFYTAVRTKVPMSIKRPDISALQPFGLVAEGVAANVYFDQPNSKAVLRNGISEVLTIDSSEPGVSYVIDFHCGCHREIQVSDFPLVYDLIGRMLPENKKIDFHGDTVVTGSFVECCRAPCFGGNLREL